MKKIKAKKKTKAKKKKALDARHLMGKALAVCETIATIAGAAGGVSWIYQHAWPFVEPIWHAGRFCPERFWWDSLALPMQRGESPVQIHAHLDEALATLRADQDHIEEWLTQHSESDRQRISDAYDRVLASVHAQYPHLSSTNVALTRSPDCANTLKRSSRGKRPEERKLGR